jgi:glutamate 5-kinase
LVQARCVVLKVGSSLVVETETGRTATRFLNDLAADAAALRARGANVVMVTSGAVALGRARLGLEKNQRQIEQKQAAAAAGQPLLMAAWSAAFDAAGLSSAQILLTAEDTERRRRWLNARSTFETLLDLGVVPIVNENDTVATAEIRYGDNDRLAARVAQLVGADLLVLLSDVDGLSTADPRREPTARRLDRVEAVTEAILAAAGGPSADSGVGTGGMRTKVEAARIAAAAGCATVVAPGQVSRPLQTLVQGGPATLFDAPVPPAQAYKQWIAGTLQPRGVLRLDAGAARAVRAGASLLPSGVAAVEGAFDKGDCVTLKGPDGVEIGRGLVRHAVEDARRIAGLRTDACESVLGYRARPELVHRDDLVVR